MFRLGFDKKVKNEIFQRKMLKEARKSHLEEAGVEMEPQT